MPIKYKLRKDKERAFKDLANDNWLNDFALEVTNTSQKPIYFLEIWLDIPAEVSPDGVQRGVALRYGRMDFVRFTTVPTAEDVPILPGETHTLVVPEKFQKGWRAHKIRASAVNPTRVELIFVQLSFGDGTGLISTGAVPYPYKNAQTLGGCREGPATRTEPSI